MDKCQKNSLEWRHNWCDSVSNHQPHDCLLKCLSRRRSKKISKLRVTGLCAGNSPGSGEFPTQRASNEGNVFIWLRHHVNISYHERPVQGNSPEIRYTHTHYVNTIRLFALSHDTYKLPHVVFMFPNLDYQLVVDSDAVFAHSSALL